MATKKLTSEQKYARRQARDAVRFAQWSEEER